MGAPEKSARGRQQIQLREQCATGHPTPSLQDRLWPKDKPLSLTQTPFCPVPIVGDSIKMALFSSFKFCTSFSRFADFQRWDSSSWKGLFTLLFLVRKHTKDLWSLFVWTAKAKIHRAFKNCTWGPDWFIRINSLSWVIYVLPLQNYFARQKAKHVPTLAMLHLRRLWFFSSILFSQKDSSFWHFAKFQMFYLNSFLIDFLMLSGDFHQCLCCDDIFDDSNLWLENSRGSSSSGDLQVPENQNWLSSTSENIVIHKYLHKVIIDESRPTRWGSLFTNFKTTFR